MFIYIVVVAMSAQTHLIWKVANWVNAPCVLTTFWISLIRKIYKEYEEEYVLMQWTEQGNANPMWYHQSWSIFLLIFLEISSFVKLNLSRV